MPRTVVTAVMPARKGARRLGPYTKVRWDKRKVFLFGLKALDGRSPAVRAYSMKRRELIDQLGGEEEVTPAQVMSIDIAVMGIVFLDHLNVQLLGQKSLVFGKGKDMRSMPLLLERMAMSRIVSEQLSKLGLERKTRTRSLTDDLLKALPAEKDKDE